MDAILLRNTNNTNVNVDKTQLQYQSESLQTTLISNTESSTAFFKQTASINVKELNQYNHEQVKRWDKDQVIKTLKDEIYFDDEDLRKIVGLKGRYLITTMSLQG